MGEKIKAKPYISILLRALIDAGKVSPEVEAFKDGMFSKVPMEIAIQKLNEKEDDIKIMIDKIVEYYNRYKSEGKI